MKKKQGLMLIASLLAASSLGVVFLEGGSGFAVQAETTYTYSCADIIFGGTLSSSQNAYAVGSTQCYTSHNVSISSFSSSDCLKSDPTNNSASGKALKFGYSGVTATFTFNFSSAYIITKAKIYANAYSSNQSGTSISVKTSAQTTAVSQSITYQDLSSVEIGDLTADTSATSAYAYTFDGLDSGNKTASNSFTLTGTYGKAPYIAKIVLTIATAAITPSSSSKSSSSSAPSSSTPSSSSSSSTPTYNPALSLSTEDLSLTAGSTSGTITATYSGFPATPTITAVSSSTGVATVSVSGSTITVIPVVAGSSTIMVTATSGSYTKTATCAVTVLAASSTGKSLQVYAVEQIGNYGDCTLFHYGVDDNSGYDLLIDGGNKTSATPLKDYLTAHVKDHVLDCLVLTHPHDDHFGGFTNGTTSSSSGGTLIDGGITSVTKIVDCGADDSQTENGSSTTYTSGWVSGVRSYWKNKGASYSAINDIKDTTTTIDSRASIHWLDTNSYCTAGATVSSSEGNNYSIACDVKFGTYEFIMCGDLPTAQEANLTSKYSSNSFVTSGDTVIFKACHHCSNGANSAEFLSYLKPTYAWTSSGIISANATSSGPSTSTQQHPYQTARSRIESQLNSTSNNGSTGHRDMFYWNGTNGTIKMTLDSTLSNFTMAGLGRSYANYYHSGAVVDAASEKTTYVELTHFMIDSGFNNA